MTKRTLPFVFLWSILGDQPSIEKVFKIKKDVPTTLALSPHSLVKITGENIFTEDELLNFLDDDVQIEDKFDPTKIRIKEIKGWKYNK